MTSLLLFHAATLNSHACNFSSFLFSHSDLLSPLRIFFIIYGCAVNITTQICNSKLYTLASRAPLNTSYLITKLTPGLEKAVATLLPLLSRSYLILNFHHYRYQVCHHHHPHRFHPCSRHHHITFFYVFLQLQIL